MRSTSCVDQDHVTRPEVQVYGVKFTKFDTTCLHLLATASSPGLPPIDRSHDSPPPHAPCLVSEQLGRSHQCAHSRYVANLSPAALPLFLLSILLCPIKPFPPRSLFSLSEFDSLTRGTGGVMAFTAFTLIPFIWLQRAIVGGGGNGCTRLSLSVLRLLLCMCVCVCFKHSLHF